MQIWGPVTSNQVKFVIALALVAVAWVVLGGCEGDTVVGDNSVYTEVNTTQTTQGDGEVDIGDEDSTAPPPTTTPCCPGYADEKPFTP